MRSGGENEGKREKKENNFGDPIFHIKYFTVYKIFRILFPQ
jgi:hypothetical protein